MEEIMAIARKFNLYVIEDNAQATGSEYIFADGTRFDDLAFSLDGELIAKAAGVDEIRCFRTDTGQPAGPRIKPSYPTTFPDSTLTIGWNTARSKRSCSIRSNSFSTAVPELERAITTPRRYVH